MAQTKEVARLQAIKNPDGFHGVAIFGAFSGDKRRKRADPWLAWHLFDGFATMAKSHALSMLPAGQLVLCWPRGGPLQVPKDVEDSQSGGDTVRDQVYVEASEAEVTEQRQR